jgi:GNAT superfamily N-acetyltransferase
VTPRSPELLSSAHDLSSFRCGVASLDDWLQRRALGNQASGASRTYVLADSARVVGYYCLAAGALALNEAPGPVRRNMPDPVPVVILGRLAIDQSMQGQGLGAALLRDAVERTEAAAAILGIRGLLVHAISEEAKLFYVSFGFLESPTQPMTLILSLKHRET